jgi:hypothetical protein
MNSSDLKSNVEMDIIKMIMSRNHATSFPVGVLYIIKSTLSACLYKEANGLACEETYCVGSLLCDVLD